MSSYNPLNKPLYYREIQNEFSNIFNISIIGYEECQKDKRKISLNKNCYIFHFVIKGKGYLKIQKNEYIPIYKNSCFLIEPGQQAKYHQDKDNPWTYFWIEINGKNIEKFVNLLAFKNNNNVINIPNIKDIKNCFFDVFNQDLYGQNILSENLRIQSLTLKIFSDLFSNTINHNLEKNEKMLSKTEEQANAIIKYINYNYTSPNLSVKNLANMFYFNSSYLNRLIKKYTGLSPKKLIIKLRMERSLVLMKKKTMTISEISFEIGYKNQFYFSKEFKEYYGVSPSEYITRHF